MSDHKCTEWDNRDHACVDCGEHYTDAFERLYKRIDELAQNAAFFKCCARSGEYPEDGSEPFPHACNKRMSKFLWQTSRSGSVRHAFTGGRAAMCGFRVPWFRPLRASTYPVCLKCEQAISKAAARNRGDCDE